MKENEPFYLLCYSINRARYMRKNTLYSMDNRMYCVARAKAFLVFRSIEVMRILFFI